VSGITELIGDFDRLRRLYSMILLMHLTYNFFGRETLIQTKGNRLMEESLIKKIDCIRLQVPDLESGLSFYRDKLGQPLIWRTEHAAGLRMPGTDSEIVLQTEVPGPEIDLMVDSADEAANRFADAGGEIIVPPFDIQIGRCVVVRDPWGNPVVLLDTSKGLLMTDDAGNVTGNLPRNKEA
jgi:predicted enzyme related to lactoylglutathione lyase